MVMEESNTCGLMCGHKHLCTCTYMYIHVCLGVPDMCTYAIQVRL